MKSFKIIFFFLILLPQIAFADNFIVPGLRVGKYKTGSVSQKFFQEKGNTPDIIMVLPKTNLILNFFDDDQVTMIIDFDPQKLSATVIAVKTTSPKYKTLTGVGVGDNIRKISGFCDIVQEDNNRIICKGAVFEKDSTGIITGITVVYRPLVELKKEEQRDNSLLAM